MRLGAVSCDVGWSRVIVNGAGEAVVLSGMTVLLPLFARTSGMFIHSLVLRVSSRPATSVEQLVTMTFRHTAGGDDALTGMFRVASGHAARRRFHRVLPE